MSEMEWLRIFGGNLQYLMGQHGMSQRGLAEAANLTQASISRYICAQQMPGPKALINIANALGISLDELMDFGDVIY
jgi:transcriptional regulator with XRE-family HTH domain